MNCEGCDHGVEVLSLHLPGTYDLLFITILHFVGSQLQNTTVFHLCIELIICYLPMNLF